MATSDSAAGGEELERISDRLGQLAKELDQDVDDERAEELVKEASRLATEAGQQLERLLDRSGQ
jgi:hypothetical protein